MRGDAAPLVDQPVGGDDDRRAGELRRARAERADPHRHQVAVAPAVADLVGVDAELGRQHLLEGRRVALAVIHAAGQQHDAAGRVEADLGVLVVAPAGRRHRRRDADAEQFAAPARRRAPVGDAGHTPRQRQRVAAGSSRNRRCRRSAASASRTASRSPGSCCGGAIRPGRRPSSRAALSMMLSVT